MRPERRRAAVLVVLLVASLFVAAAPVGKLVIDFGGSEWFFPAVPATVKLKIVKTGKATGFVQTEVLLNPDGTYAFALDGELYDYGFYLHPDSFSKKVYFLPTGDAQVGMLLEEEAGLEAGAALEGLDVDFTFGGFASYTSRMSAKTLVKQGVAVGKLRYAYKAVGVVSGEGLFLHPFTYSVKATGPSLPIPLSDIASDT